MPVANVQPFSPRRRLIVREALPAADCGQARPGALVRRRALVQRRRPRPVPSRLHAAPPWARPTPRGQASLIVPARTAERASPCNERRLPAPRWRRSAVIAGSLALTLIGAAIAPENHYPGEPALADTLAARPRLVLEQGESVAQAQAEVARAQAEVAQAQAELAQIENQIGTTGDVPEAVRRAIDNATREVGGIDADYLTVVAARESSFDPEARAHSTSAAGLYQFTAGTWLRAVKMFGAKHGLADYADLITIDEDGFVSMRHGTTRTELLELRSDPELAALMAAELALDNKLRLERILGRSVTPAETYMAHLFGVVPASRVIAAARSAPHVAGAELLPTAARTNPNIFNAAGTPVSARDIVKRIRADFSRHASHSGTNI